MTFVSELNRADVKTVLGKFGLRELHSFREFALGIENANIKVKTEKGAFVLKQWLEAKPNNIVFELSLMKELHKKGFPVPKAFKSRNGTDVVEFKGKRFALLEFMPGKHVKRSELSPRQLFETGTTLAEMQLALMDFRPKGESQQLDLFDFGLEHRSVKNAFPKVCEWHQKALKALEKEARELEPKLKATKKGLRVGPVHHDFFYWNILFKGNKISAILDFGDACIGAWASDLAVALSDPVGTKDKKWCSKMKQIMKGYQAKIIPTKEELQALPYLMLHRAIQIPFFETNAMLKQPKNRALYEKWVKEELARVKQIKKQLPKIKKALEQGLLHPSQE